MTLAKRPRANAVASDDQPAEPNVTTTGSLRRQASASPSQTTTPPARTKLPMTTTASERSP